ncbi:hypothetical protein HYS31_06930 [Candidatus Woesearchaeota archaeon]|nr:hypothetical protein [Candidatus Woesearchaeota archaeon]
MPQNRNKLIDLFIGNIANAVVHKILEHAIHDELLRRYYDKELLNSVEAAKKYREEINPINRPLQEKDIENIKSKVTNKVNNELRLRIVKGYKNINLDSVVGLVDEMLIGMKIKD